MRPRQRGHERLPGIERSEARRDDDLPHAGIARHQLDKAGRPLLDGNRIDAELGKSFDAAELGAHADLVPDAVGQRHGFDRRVTVGEATQAPVEGLVCKCIPCILRHADDANDRSQRDEKLGRCVVQRVEQVQGTGELGRDFVQDLGRVGLFDPARPIEPSAVHHDVERAKVASNAGDETLDVLPLGDVALAVLAAKPFCAEARKRLANLVGPGAGCVRIRHGRAPSQDHGRTGFARQGQGAACGDPFGSTRDQHHIVRADRVVARRIGPAILKPRFADETSSFGVVPSRYERSLVGELLDQSICDACGLPLGVQELERSNAKLPALEVDRGREGIGRPIIVTLAARVGGTQANPADARRTVARRCGGRQQTGRARKQVDHVA